MIQPKPFKLLSAIYGKTFPLRLFFCLLLVAGSSARSQTEPKIKPAALLTSFPFQTLYGGIIIVKVQLEDFADSLNFVFDTGSGGISLDSSTVEYFKITSQASDKVIRGIAGIKKVRFVMDKTLQFPGLKVQHLDFHINDYDLLTSVYGVKIDGIIGFSFLSRYIVKINYDKQIIEIWEHGAIRYPRTGYLLKPTIIGLPFFNATITDGNSVNSSFYFDTGAGLCLLMSEAFNTDSSILKKKKKITITQAEGLGGKKEMKITTVKEMRVGPYRFRKVPAYIFDDEFNVTNYPKLGGVIGNDLFRRFNLVINYREREIHMMPNTHFNESFDYAYTGLCIYYVDGAVVVEEVIEKSPAEKAGFKPGDKILAINNDVSGNIQTYKALLQTAKARLKVIVMRNEVPIILNLQVKSIL